MKVHWWKKIFYPVKKALVSIASRVKARKTDVGLTKLHNDVQTCTYNDVQVMWEILRRSEMELQMSSSPAKPRRSFGKASSSSS